MSRSSKKDVAVLSGAYLEGAESKNETVRRLREITSQLSSSEISPSSHPTLASLPPFLCSTPLLRSPDKQIRLHVVLACMELFYVYAPSPPWDDAETLDIFDQTIRQLGNLAHCTASKEFDSYFRILEMLSEVKIGVVLVDLIRTESECRTRAEETLQELIKTLLAGVHLDHPPEVGTHAENAIAACLEEFETVIPIGVLDELLLAVGQGPVVYVPNPEYAKAVARKKRDGAEKELPPKEIQQTNCAYLVAAKVIRKTEDKVSSPVAALLNGLLGGDESVVRKTSIACADSEEWGVKKKGTIAVTAPSNDVNVYSITYELHRIAPNILTTVIGTVASNLLSADVGARGRATQLLGRLFGARTSDVARRFGPCFREWLRRSIDSEPKIRETMVKCLTNFLSNKHAETSLCEDVNDALTNIILNEPVLDIRLLAIHQVCDLAHNATYGNDETVSRQSNPPISVIAAELLQAVGNRVGSKNKTEHRDTITGLGQIYHRHFVKRKLNDIQEGGDNINIGEILEVLRTECLSSSADKRKKNTAEDKFGWIPQKVFECVSFPDATDPDMRNRVFQLVDDVLLGSAKSPSLSPTSRAVGLAIILHSLKDKENAKKWMTTLFTQRANLQRALASYLDARLRAKNCESGSAEAFTADAEAMEKLEVVASLTAPIGSGSPLNSDAAFAVLKKLHTAKDKHIFRILSTIATPIHSPSARARAFDELPKRTNSLGNETSSWVKSLARRCAMGSFFNTESIEHCIILSQECFEAGDCEASSLFLECVKIATSVFPALGATGEGFKNLAEFFDSCQTTSVSVSTKKDMDKFGLVTSISDILAKAASSRPTVEGKSKSDESTATLRSQLLRLCTRDGTPEQAKNSVHAISSLINPHTKTIDVASRIRKEKDEFLPLLKALVNPSRLSIPDDDSNLKHQSRIVSVLSAIAAISECAPYAFNAPGEAGKSGWGKRALDFSLNTVLLGKRQSINSSLDADGNTESENDGGSPEKSGRSSPRKTSSRKLDEASVHCRMLCGAIEVLISHIKSTILKLKTDRTQSKYSELEAPPSSFLSEVFCVLVRIIEDGGVPPSSVNGRYCNAEEDQAELRRCAAVNLIKLSDASLQLEHKYLTPRMWHILSCSVLDKEASVREAVMEELSTMYTASRFLPSLRFVALITLCVDSDHGHLSANANAANVGRRSASIKSAATHCIKSIRNTFQSTQAQCRSLGREAETNFENRLKMKIMPEYCVPYAFHLLAFRHETPGAAGALNADDSFLDEDELANAEASQKTLKKRLKWLFDPLIQSLGEGADNISFLLRMVELIGKHPPIDVTKSPSASPLGIELDDASVADGSNEKEAAARMQVICQFARESLLSYVKKDVNLTVYPGSIAVPADLFAPRLLSSQSPIHNDESEEDVPQKKLQPARKSKSKKTAPVSKAKKATPAPSRRSSKKLKARSAPPRSTDDEVDVIDGNKDLLSPAESPSSSLPVSSATKGDESSVFGDDGPLFSPASSPVRSDTADFANGLDVSPIVQAETPVKRSRKETQKHVSGPASKTADRKRKSNDVEHLDEFPSPFGSEGPTFLSSQGSTKEKVSSNKAKKRKSTPTPAGTSTTGTGKKSSSNKSKATPVSIDNKVMVNITNSSGSTKNESAAAKKKKVPKNAMSQGTDDEFDFFISPPKAAVGRSGKSPSLLPEKSTPARKTRAPSKVKVGKGKKVADSSPSTTSPSEPSPPSARRGTRSSARLRT